MDCSGNSHAVTSSTQHARPHPAYFCGLIASAISLSPPASPERIMTITVSSTDSTSMAFLVPHVSGVLLSLYLLILQLRKDLRQIPKPVWSSLPWTPAFSVSSPPRWHRPLPLSYVKWEPQVCSCPLQPQSSHVPQHNRTLAWVSPSGLRTRPPSRAMLLPVGLHCLSTSVSDCTTPNFQGAVLLSNAAFNCNIFYFI